MVKTAQAGRSDDADCITASGKKKGRVEEIRYDNGSNTLLRMV